jgi:hypothetical protein
LHDFLPFHPQDKKREEKRRQCGDAVIYPPRWIKQDVSVAYKEHANHNHNKRRNRQRWTCWSSHTFAGHKQQNRVKDQRCGGHEYHESTYIRQFASLFCIRFTTALMNSSNPLFIFLGV